MPRFYSPSPAKPGYYNQGRTKLNNTEGNSDKKQKQSGAFLFDETEGTEHLGIDHQPAQKIRKTGIDYVRLCRADLNQVRHLI
jgi:hypothetical protein